MKRLHFNETLASGNFLVWSSAIHVHCCAALYLPQVGGGKLFCNDGEGDPLQALFEGSQVNKPLASSDFTFRKR